MGNGLPKEANADEERGNVGNIALHVIELCGPGDKISLFLKDWELAKVASSCHMALDMLCQEMREAELPLLRGPCHSNKSLSLTVDGL